MCICTYACVLSVHVCIATTDAILIYCHITRQMLKACWGEPEDFEPDNKCVLHMRINWLTVCNCIIRNRDIVKPCFRHSVVSICLNLSQFLLFLTSLVWSVQYFIATFYVNLDSLSLAVSVYLLIRHAPFSF